jgi:hypothetical protein
MRLEKITILNNEKSKKARKKLRTRILRIEAAVQHPLDKGGPGQACRVQGQLQGLSQGLWFNPVNPA